MGGMIGQWMAVNHAKRVKSLTSIMSSTGSFSLPHHAMHYRYVTSNSCSCISPTAQR
jgi:hypothetical protein